MKLCLLPAQHVGERDGDALAGHLQQGFLHRPQTDECHVGEGRLLYLTQLFGIEYALCQGGTEGAYALDVHSYGLGGEDAGG